MAETLLILVLGLAILAAVYGAGRLAASMEQRAHERRLSGLVYYPERGRKADSQGPLPRHIPLAVTAGHPMTSGGKR